MNYIKKWDFFGRTGKHLLYLDYIMSNVPTDMILYNKIKEKVKASVKKWPSAYASGMLVKQYKEAMLKNGKEPYVVPKKSKAKKRLTRWFAENK